MIQCAVCDDEPYMAREIAGQLTAYLADRGISGGPTRHFSSGSELLACGDDFDVIFLDIQMAPPDGMETARRLRQRGSGALLIFVTVLREMVFDAFSVEAFDYLVKPIEPERFRHVMDRVMLRLRHDRLVLRSGNACEVIPLKDIAYCEVQGRKLYVHQRSGRVTDAYGRLEALTKAVDGRFFRCHRSYLVNLDFVRGCRDGLITLAQGEKIPVSRLRQEALLQALLLHMKGKGG